LFFIFALFKIDYHSEVDFVKFILGSDEKKTFHRKS
jgi:hypothetical protein